MRRQIHTVPTGALSIRMDESHYFWRKKWEDGKAQRVEGCLNKFLIDVHHFIESRAKERKRRAEADRVIEEKRMRREMLLQLQQEERDRIAKLEDDVALWQKSEMIRGYVEAFRRSAEASGTSVAPDSEAGEWILWARAHADRLDPLVKSPPSVLDDGVDLPYY